jgi:hypothetical protein
MEKILILVHKAKWKYNILVRNSLIILIEFLSREPLRKRVFRIVLKNILMRDDAFG